MGVFKKTDTYNPEYCVTIVKIGEIHDIKGKDLIGYTYVNGESIVVRKDQVKQDDIMFYASNETELNRQFLSVNNLFRKPELNKNGRIVRELTERKDALNEELKRQESEISTIKAYSEVVLSDVSSEVSEEGVEHELIDKIEAKTDILQECDERITTIQTYIDTVIKPKIKEVSDDITDHGGCGFFEENGRVRAIKLGGVVSMGFLFSIREMNEYLKTIKEKEVDCSEMIGEDFNYVGKEEFVKAYVPFRREKTHRKTKHEKRAELYDRLVKGQFEFHYDTQPLPKNIHKIHPHDMLTVSVKVHGTSCIVGNVLVKKPKRIALYKRLTNWMCKMIHKPKPYIDYTEEYGPVYSSRKVIKNQYINKKQPKNDIFATDIWSEYGKLLYHYIPEGMTVYGEIVGYETDTRKMIQEGYDYGCTEGRNKFMPYRIVVNQDGKKSEWSVMEVSKWTEDLMEREPDLSKRLMVIPILSHSTLSALYPSITVENHWHENVLLALRADKEHFGMESNEPLCKTKVPREGIVVRIDNDPVAEAFKLKTNKFFDRERKMIDEGKCADMEMVEEFGQ